MRGFWGGLGAGGDGYFFAFCNSKTSFLLFLVHRDTAFFCISSRFYWFPFHSGERVKLGLVYKKWGGKEGGKGGGKKCDYL